MQQALRGGIDLRALVLRFPVRRNRLATGRQLVQNRNIQIAIKRQRQGARNRRCGHYENMGALPLFRQRLSLKNAEAVLLVNDNESEFGEIHAFLNQRMGSDRDAGLSAHQSLSNATLFFFGQAADSKFDRDAERLQQSSQYERVLLRENFGRGHERGPDTRFSTAIKNRGQARPSFCPIPHRPARAGFIARPARQIRARFPEWREIALSSA